MACRRAPAPPIPLVHEVRRDLDQPHVHVPRLGIQVLAVALVHPPRALGPVAAGPVGPAELALAARRGRAAAGGAAGGRGLALLRHRSLVGVRARVCGRRARRWWAGGFFVPDD